MTTMQQHYKDPLTPEERQEAHEETLKAFRRCFPKKRGEQLWMETTYCGVWCGTYRIGDYSHSGRYVFVGIL